MAKTTSGWGKPGSRPRSRLSAVIYETAAGLRRIGLLNKTTMREFDSSCLRRSPDKSSVRARSV